jgi:hypothetical protein
MARADRRRRARVARRHQRSGSWEPGDTDVTANDGVLDGTAYFVQDARKVRFFVVSARGSAGVGLYAVAADAPGVTITPDRITDLTRDQATVRFEKARAEIVAAPGKGAAVLEQALPAILTIVAADLCGAAGWQLQTTTSTPASAPSSIGRSASSRR